MSRVLCHCMVTIPGTYEDIFSNSLVANLQRHLDECDIECELFLPLGRGF